MRVKKGYMVVAKGHVGFLPPRMENQMEHTMETEMGHETETGVIGFYREYVS